MLKKIIVATLVVIVAGAVAVGAYDAYRGNSTLNLPSLAWAQSSQNSGQGRGQGQGQGQRQGRGRGQQSGQAQGNRGQAGGGEPMMEHEWTTLTGVVVSADGQSMVVDTAEQGEMTLQLGEMGFAESQGVAFNPGDQVTVLGFEGENGLFQVGQVNNETTGEALMLRDPNGRPLWAGRGQGGDGEPMAAANEWVTLQGVVVSAQQGLVVDTAERGELMVELGPPWFASEQAVVFNPGDSVTIVGFDGNGGMFQAGQITNETTGETLMLRDPNGRPLWAGRGREMQGN
ncbi:MAG: hypothetical protein D6784_14215 [Chloroflexi bacterium]|nr:MAG: hypothetical protein D6784_14215 [Chloroflexota bacterium]